MKRLLALLLALVMLLSLAACGSDDDDDTDSDSKKTGNKKEKGTTFETENFSAYVPDGWYAYPVADVFAEEENAINPNALQICKGDHDFQVTLYVDQPKGKLSLQDKDVQKILESLKPAADSGNSEKTQEKPEPQPDSNKLQDLVDTYKGDWVGLVELTDCTDAYISMDDEVVLAAARFRIDDTGYVQGWIGAYLYDLPFTELYFWLDEDEGVLYCDGTWDGESFYDVAIEETAGTLHFELEHSADDGDVTMSFNLRRLGDEGWTDEDPGFDKDDLAYLEGMTCDDVTEMMGYTSADYPA